LSGNLIPNSSVAWDKRIFVRRSDSSGTAGDRAGICGEAVASELERGSKRRREDVWEVERSGVSL
jgi:hypothetical protein